MTNELLTENALLKEKLKGYEWIPCSERLPDKDGDYLATCCVCGYVYVGISRYLICDDGDIFWELQNVLAWKPLPEPYRGTDE